MNYLQHKYENTDSHHDDRTPCNYCGEPMREVELTTYEGTNEFHYCSGLCATIDTNQRAQAALRAIQLAEFIG